jgi:hypothetical protein
MQLTDQELFYILQVKSPAKPRPWENNATAPLGRDWAEWAKAEVLSGKDVGSARGINLERCSIYLARLLRVLETVAEHGGLETRRREEDAYVHEESTIKTLLSDGLEACGCPAFNHQDALFLAKHNGLIFEHEYDDWQPGMASGSGWRTYYGLTFKGKRQAEKASFMPSVCENTGKETLKAESAESPKHQPSKDNEGKPPSTSEQPPDIPAEDWQNAGLIVLLLLAQAYYKLLESAVRNPCGAMDLDLNGRYLWAVNNLTNLLKNHHNLADFPGTFEPCLKDLMPSSIVDVDWNDMVAPDAERFLSTVQQYVMTKGSYPPEEGTAAWIFVETFKSSVNEAIQVGETYSKRMAKEFRKFLGTKKQSGPGASDTTVTPKTATIDPPTTASPSAHAQTGPTTTQTSETPGLVPPMKKRSVYAGDTDYTAVPLDDIIAHLRDWRDDSTRSSQLLRKNKAILEQLKSEVPQEFYDSQFTPAMEKWRRATEGLTEIPHHLELSKPYLPKYSDVEEFIEVFIAEFDRYTKEFNQLIEQLPQGVRPGHAEALRQIVIRCDRLDTRCRNFREDYVRCSPWSDLAEEVYNETRDMMADYLDLSNAATRLDVLVGSSAENVITQTSPKSGQTLAMKKVWEPRKMLWNKKPFIIEKPAACQIAYGPEISDFDMPEDRDEWPPPEELHHLQILTFVSYEKTLSVQILLKTTEVLYPERLESSGENLGWHAGGAIVVDGAAFNIKGVRVEETEPNERAQIDAERRARCTAPENHSNHDDAIQSPIKPKTMETSAILTLCSANPNQAFLYWKSFEEDLSQCPSVGGDEGRKIRAMRDTFQEWFEDLGHWRDLKPKAKDLDPDDHKAHSKHQKQIEEFVTSRRSRLHQIDYDEVRMAHNCQHEGTEHENVEYNWEFFRDGISQVIVRTAGGNVRSPHSDPVRRQYFKNTPPHGYAILESDNKLQGAIFFPNGEHYDFDPCFGDENRFYPDGFFKAGDYELRRVGKKNASLDALHADVREIKQFAIPLPGAIANVEKGIESMLPHVRGIPKVLADLKEARLVPEEATRELFSQIQDLLTIEDQRIWTAVRTAGTQKGAVELLREANLIMSEATLSRRVRDIDEKLRKKGLPPCKASGPSGRFSKSGGYTNAEGKAVAEDLTPVEKDWANDQAERDSTIQAYLNANSEDKVFFRHTKPGIEEEAQKYLKRRPMKSD